MAKNKKKAKVQDEQAPVEETAAEGAATAVLDAPQAPEEGSEQAQEADGEHAAPPAKPDFDPADYRERDEPTTEAERIADSRKALGVPLPAGMKAFESPEGYIVVGEANKEHVWCRHANGGKGMNINPRR